MGDPVSSSNPILRFQPNQTAWWSRGWNFDLANRVKTNNFGFINLQDYDPASKLPLVAIIGDSFVEALMVPQEQTCYSLLAQKCSGKLRFYSFATSGSPLSQYLVYAKYAKEQFKPQAFVFVIVANDFDESLLKYKNAPGFHYFKETPNGSFELVRVDQRQSPLYCSLRVRNWLLRSSFVRYLIDHLQILNLPQKIAYAFKNGKTNFISNVPAQVDETRQKDSEKAVSFFLDKLPEFSDCSPKEIVFVVDGIRQGIYDNSLEKLENSFFGKMRRYFISEAAKKGFEVIDMQPVFKEHFQKHRLRFEYPTDAHWNSTAHKICAEEVFKSPPVTKLLNQISSASQQ